MADQTILALSRSASFRPGETVETQHATDGTGKLDLGAVLSVLSGGANADLLFSDGATTNRAVSWALGTAGAVAGKVISVPFEVFCPTANPTGTSAYAAIIGTALLTNSLAVYITTGGQLNIAQFGATTTDYRLFSYAGFRAACSGQWVRGFVVFESPDSTTPPKVYLQGVDASALFSASTSGSYTNWVPATLDTTSYFGGLAWTAGRFVPYAPILGALSAAEVLTWTQTGRFPSWCDTQTGSAVPKYAGNFSAGLDGWSATPSSGGCAAAGNVDGINGQDDWMSIQRTSTTGLIQAERALNSELAGIPLSFAFETRIRVYNPTGTPRYFGVGFAGFVKDADGAYTVGLVPAGGQSDLVLFRRVSAAEVAPLTSLRIVSILANGNPDSTVPVGDVFYFKSIQVRVLGPLFKPVIPASGTTILDAGTNNLTGTITAGVMPVVTRFTSSHIADFAAALLPGTSGRALQPHCLSDNATAGRRIEWTPGTAGNVAGKPVVLYGRINVPTSNPSVICYAAMLASTASDPDFQIGSLRLAISNAGSLSIRQIGATTADQRTFAYAGFRAAYSGRKALPIAVVFPNGDTTANPIFWIDGIDVTALFTLTTSGSVNWMPTTLDCTKFLSGYNWCDTRFEPFRLCLGAWTAAEVADWAQTGREPMWCEASTGSAVNRISGDSSTFTSGFGAWFNEASGLASLTATAGKMVLGLASSGVGVAAYPAGFSPGIRYRITLKARLASGSSVPVQVGSSSGNAFSLIPDSTERSFSGEFTAATTAARVMVISSNGATIEVDDIEIYALGPIIKPVLQPCMILDDEGTNGIPGVITAGIKPVTNKKDWRIRPVIDMTTTGNKQAFGAAFTENALAHAFDSIEVTHGANGATYSVGDGTTATAYTASAAQTSGRKRLTLTNPFPADAAKTGLYVNVTVAGASETAVPVVIKGHRID